MTILILPEGRGDVKEIVVERMETEEAKVKQFYTIAWQLGACIMEAVRNVDMSKKYNRDAFAGIMESISHSYPVSVREPDEGYVQQIWERAKAKEFEDDDSLATQLGEEDVET